MRINIPKFAQGAAASSTLTIVGVCLVVVVATVPIIAVSFSAMALWKSPESVPAMSGSDLSFDSDGAPTNLGSLAKDCPAAKTLSPTYLTNYNKWLPYINASVEGKSISPALVAAILYKENGKMFPDPINGKCTNEPNCDHKWYVSSANAYGPFQFQTGTWWDFGTTKEERQAAYDAKIVTTLPKQDAKYIDTNVFDPARSAKAAANMLSHYFDKSEETTAKGKVRDAILAYNHSTAYANDVYEYYQTLSACIQSSFELSDVPPPGLSQTEKILWWARHELKLIPSLSSKPPAGYHTASGENKVKYMNSDVNNSTSVVPGDWRDLGWCMAFVTWVYEKAGYDIRPRIFASLSEFEKIFDNEHTWTSQESLSTLDPKLLKNRILPGDIIIMRSGRAISGMHAGIVEFVDADGRIHTIEGNVGNDEIARRDYKLDQWVKGTDKKRIIGFGRW